MSSAFNSSLITEQFERGNLEDGGLMLGYQRERERKNESRCPLLATRDFGVVVEYCRQIPSLSS